MPALIPTVPVLKVPKDEGTKVAEQQLTCSDRTALLLKHETSVRILSPCLPGSGGCWREQPCGGSPTRAPVPLRCAVPPPQLSFYSPLSPALPRLLHCPLPVFISVFEPLATSFTTGFAEGWWQPASNVQARAVGCCCWLAFPALLLPCACKAPDSLLRQSASSMGTMFTSFNAPIAVYSGR